VELRSSVSPSERAIGSELLEDKHESLYNRRRRIIGSHLAERFLKEDCSVSIIDDLSTGSIENIAHLKSNPKFTYAIASVFDRPLVAEMVDEADIVFHLAAAVGVRLIVESPVRTIETNVHGTEVVLQAVAKKRKRVIIASTSEVYGKSTDVAFPGGRGPGYGTHYEGPVELCLL